MQPETVETRGRLTVAERKYLQRRGHLRPSCLRLCARRINAAAAKPRPSAVRNSGGFGPHCLCPSLLSMASPFMIHRFPARPQGSLPDSNSQNSAITGHAVWPLRIKYTPKGEGCQRQHDGNSRQCGQACKGPLFVCIDRGQERRGIIIDAEDR